jgi:hypothetical protein
VAQVDRVELHAERLLVIFIRAALNQVGIATTVTGSVLIAVGQAAGQLGPVASSV